MVYYNTLFFNYNLSRNPCVRPHGTSWFCGTRLEENLPLWYAYTRRQVSSFYHKVCNLYGCLIGNALSEEILLSFLVVNISRIFWRQWTGFVTVLYVEIVRMSHGAQGSFSNLMIRLETIGWVASYVFCMSSIMLHQLVCCLFIVTLLNTY